jgi:hypothetical protein
MNNIWEETEKTFHAGLVTNSYSAEENERSS